MDFSFTDNYIFPNIYKYSSSDDIFEKKERSHLKNNLEDVYNSEYAILIGDPGTGKSRLLREFFLVDNKSEKSCAYIDLKKILYMNFEEILSYLKNIESISKNTKDLEEFSSLKSNNFDISNNNTKIYFDCVDELSRRNSLAFFKFLEELKSEFKYLKILIATRINHIEKYGKYITDKSYKKFIIKRFTNEDVKNYLTKNKIPKHYIDLLLDLDLEIIFNPRYLSYIRFLVANDLIEIKKINNRSNLLNELIISKLEDSTKNILKNDYSHEEVMTLRVLEFIALSMEVKQVNQISVENFIDFFENIESEVCKRYFYRNKIDILYSNTVLKKNGIFLEFEDREIQEFLAARILSKYSNYKKIIFEFAVDKSEKNFYVSWFNTISYFLEFKPRLFLDIIGYVNSQTQVNNISVYRVVEYLNKNVFTNEEKCSIGFEMYRHIQGEIAWLPHEVRKFISECSNCSWIIDELGNILERLDINNQIDDIKGNFYLGNFLLVIYDFIKSNSKRDLEEHLTKKIKNISEYSIIISKNSLVQRTAVSIICELKDIDLLRKIEKSLNFDDELTERSLINSSIKNFVDSEYTINLLLKSLERNNNNSYYIREGVMKISSQKILAILIDKLNQNDDLFRSMLKIFSFRSNQYKKFINIDKIHEIDLIKKIEEFIYNVITGDASCLFIAKKSDFFYAIIELFKDSNYNEIMNIILKSTDSKGMRNYFYLISDILTRLLNKNNFWIIEKWIDSKNESKNYYSNLLKEIERHGENDYKFFKRRIDRKLGFFTVLKNYFRKKKISGINNRNQTDLFDFDSIYQRINYFNENSGRIIEDLDNEKKFNFIADCKKEIQRLEPKKFECKMDSNGRFTYDVEIDLFNNLILALTTLDQDISKFRSKLILFIPFAYGNVIDILVNSIGVLNRAEERNFIEYLLLRNDSEVLFQISSIIKFISYNNISSDKMVAFLVKMLDSNISNNEKIKLIRLIDQLKHNREFLLNLYDEEKLSINNNLFLELNRLLILRYDYEDSIDHRIKLLDSFCEKFSRPKGIHTVSPIESEFMDYEIAEVLFSIPIHYEKKLLNKLESTFSLYNKDENYYAYIRYIWYIVEQFYKYNMDLEKNISVSELKEIMESKQDEQIKILFRSKLLDLLSYKAKAQVMASTFKDSIRFINETLNDKKFINDLEFLKDIILEVIEVDIRNWIENQGAYRLINDMKGKQEDLIQRTIVSEIQLSLLKRGLDVEIDREIELIDKKKLDIVISYGFVGRVIIELKRLDNNDIIPSKLSGYMDKLIQYRKALSTDYLIFLIIKINERLNLSNRINEIQNEIDRRKSTNNDSGIIVKGVNGIL